jgi:Rap1a immunity proteins
MVIFHFLPNVRLIAKSRTAGAFILICGSSASAEMHESDSANYVMPGCRNYISDDPRKGDIFKSGLCWGLISGVTYAPEDTCLPPTATQKQAVSVVVQYIDTRHARMHEDFRKLALEAFKAARPCTR